MYLKNALSANRVLLLLFGAPGTGKGTFGRQLASDCGLLHLSTGDLLRKEIQRDSALGHQIKDTISNGLHIDDDIVCSIARAEIELCSKGVILDGIPRTVFQAHFVNSFASASNLPLIGVDLTLERNVLIQRLLGRRHCTHCNRNYNICTINTGDYAMDALLPSKSDILRCPGCADLKQRSDDNEDVIKRRLAIHESNCAAVFAALKRIPMMSFAIKRGIKDYDLFKDKLESFVKEHVIW